MRAWVWALLLSGCIENALAPADELPCVPIDEVCDGVDNDCDGRVDDGIRCPAAWDFPDPVADTADTAETEPPIVELCNGVDDDGDTEVDEGFDLDGDGVARCCDDGGEHVIWYADTTVPPYTTLAGRRSNRDGTFAPTATLDFVTNGGQDIRILGYGHIDEQGGNTDLDLYWYRTSDSQTYTTSCTGGEWQTIPRATLDRGPASWGDFDGDGCLDYVTWDYPGGYFGDHGGTGMGITYRGGCDGTFTRQTDTTWTVTFLAGEWTGGTPLQTGDWNGDGHADLFFWAVAHGGAAPSDLWYLPGTGTGDFGAAVALPALGTAANSGAMGDIDGDRCLDFVMGSNDDGDTGSVWAVLGDCVGGVKTTRRLVDQRAVATAAGQTMYGDGGSRLYDFDGDGDLDLVTSTTQTYSGNAAIFYWENDGGGRFPATPTETLVPMYDIRSNGVMVPLHEPPPGGTPCGAVTTTTTCAVNLTAGGVTCTGADPTSVVAFDNGTVLRLDMADWRVVTFRGTETNPTGFSWNLGDSQSNDGWGGDASHTAHDSEAMAWTTSVLLYQSDAVGGGHVTPSAAAFTTSPVDFTVEVCDGRFTLWAAGGTWAYDGDGIFQIDGDEADAQAPGGLNDRFLWLGLNRVIGNPSRTGTGLSDVTLTFGR